MRLSLRRSLLLRPVVYLLPLLMALGVAACSADYGISDPSDIPGAPSLTNPIVVANADQEPAEDSAVDTASEESDATVDDATASSDDAETKAPLPEADPLEIKTTELKSWNQGEKNTQTLKAHGGSKKYLWEASGLPEGLTIVGKKIKGSTTAEAKIYSVTITLTDKVTDESVEEDFDLEVVGKNEQIAPGGVSIIGVDYGFERGRYVGLLEAEKQDAPLVLTVDHEEQRRSMASPKFMDEKCSEAGILDPTECAQFRDAQKTEDESIAQTKVPGQSGKLSDNEVARAFRIILTVRGGKGAYTWIPPEAPDLLRYYPDLPVTHVGAGWEAIHDGRDEAWQGKEGWSCKEYSDSKNKWTGCKYVFVPIIFCEYGTCGLPNGSMEPSYLDVMYDNPHTLHFTVRDEAGHEASIDVNLAVTLQGKTCVENGKCN